MFDQPDFVPIEFNPAKRQVSPELESYDEISLLGNPLPRYDMARNFHYQRLFVRGNEHGFKVKQQDTEPTLEGNKTLLKSIGRSTLIAVVGGDGTASMLMHAAYDLGLDNPFMILNGGNAINQSRMHHQSRHSYRPERILRKGRIERDNPLVITKELPNGESRTDLAFAYNTFGLTALATAGFNTPEHREMVDEASDSERRREEFKITMAARQDVIPFIIHEPGKPARIRAELGYVSGKLMAKYMRFPADLFSKEAVVIEAPDIRLITAGRTIVSLALPGARRRHDWLVEGERHRLRIETIDGSDINYERDGDAGTDPSGTTYTFSISDKSV